MNLYKRTSHLAWRSIEGQAYIVNTRSSMLHECNGAATFIWKLLEKPVSLQEIERRLSETYDVSPDEARADAGEFIGELQQKGLVEAVNG